MYQQRYNALTELAKAEGHSSEEVATEHDKGQLSNDAISQAEFDKIIKARAAKVTIKNEPEDTTSDGSGIVLAAEVEPEDNERWEALNPDDREAAMGLLALNASGGDYI